MNYFNFSEEIDNRINSVCNNMQEKDIIIIFSGEDSFQIDPNFFYLTGERIHNACLILDNSNKKRLLFVSKTDPKSMIWDGPNDIRNSQLGNCYDIQDMGKLEGYIAQLSLKNCYSNYSKLTTVDHKNKDPDQIIGKSRMIKSDYEINLIQSAVDHAISGHEKIMHKIKTYDYEYQVAADYIATVMSRGHDPFPYPLIIGSGSNSCILHYRNNNAKIKPNELLLLDCGAKVDGYCSDLTRTIPTSGKFSSLAAELYAIVLSAQNNALKQIKPGVTYGEISSAVLSTIVQGLLDLNLLSGSITEIIADRSYNKYYMHSFGHMLGLEVHDPMIFTGKRDDVKLATNMVLTVEPGIYVKEHGIGIRIEDNIAITETGCQVLSKRLTNDLYEIENVCS